MVIFPRQTVLCPASPPACWFKTAVSPLSQLDFAVSCGPTAVRIGSDLVSFGSDGVPLGSDVGPFGSDVGPFGSVVVPFGARWCPQMVDFRSRPVARLRIRSCSTSAQRVV